jgi:hypothetical protein
MIFHFKCVQLFGNLNPLEVNNIKTVRRTSFLMTVDSQNYVNMAVWELIWKERTD